MGYKTPANSRVTFRGGKKSALLFVTVDDDAGLHEEKERHHSPSELAVGLCNFFLDAREQ